MSPCFSLKLCIQLSVSFPFSLAFHFFPQLFVKPPRKTTLLFYISFSLGWFWSPCPGQCYEPLSVVLQALLIPWMYLSPPWYNHSEVKWKSFSCVQLFMTPWTNTAHGILQAGQNTGVGSFSLPPGLFPTQGSNPGLPHCGQILYQLSHKGSPRILEWVAYPFSSRSSRSRNRTGVSCIAGRFFTNWAIREACIIIRGLI